MEMNIRRRYLPQNQCYELFGTYENLELVEGEYVDGKHKFGIRVIKTKYATLPNTVYECRITSSEGSGQSVPFEQQSAAIKIVLARIMGLDVTDPQIEGQLKAISTPRGGIITASATPLKVTEPPKRLKA